MELTEDTKTCTLCKLEKPLNEFGNLKRGKKGKNSWCKPCAAAYRKNWVASNPDKYDAMLRKSKLKALYGITPEDYQAMLEQQNHACAICKKKCRSGYRLSVDHDHETGQVRGLLCRACNQVLGLAGESVAILEGAISYLSEANQWR